MSTPALRVARAFLQTVVVVDDHAYSEPPTAPVETATLGDDSPVLEIDEASGPPDVEPQPDSEDFDTSTVVEGFADLGIACAPIAPDYNDPELSSDRLLKLAARADVVILDWIIRPVVAGPSKTMGPQPSRTSIDLLLNIFRSDADSDPRLRLICVYTGTRDLGDVLAQIAVGLKKLVPDLTIDVNNLRIEAQGTRVVVLPKWRDPIDGFPTVSATELPERVVDEFSRFAADGMLPRLALSSIAAVRRRTHRLLRRFRAELDPALIAHRSWTSHPDTSAFAVGLVGDELASILASEQVADSVGADDFNHAITGYMGSHTRFLLWTAFRDEARHTIIAPDDVKRALEDGVDVDNKMRIRGSSMRVTKATSLTSLMVEHDDSVELTDDVLSTVRTKARTVDLEFSALSSLSRDRRFDAPHLTRPPLQLGALVSRAVGRPAINGEAGPLPPDESPANDEREPSTSPLMRYWMCIQPLCDSVRLSSATRFPFVPLVRCDANAEGFDLVVFDGTYVPLRLGGRRFSDIEFFEFGPDSTTLTVTARSDDEHWRFQPTDGLALDWLGQVRIDKAQTIASALAGNASRPGLDEYDFLRRISSRPN